MKQLIIYILIAIACSSYYYLVGYCKGYDDAKESYTGFYEKMIQKYITMYEENIKELFNIIQEYHAIRKGIHPDQEIL